MTAATEVFSACAIVDTALLINALPKFSKIIRSNARIPILRGIRLIAADGGLDLYGTSLDISLQMSLPAGLLNMYEASIIVDYKALHQAVKAIKDQRMRISYLMPITFTSS